MPRFKFNKLVRDKLRNEYERIGQKASYRVLTPFEHKNELKRKIVEETQEIQLDKPVDEIMNEIADTRQTIDDLMTLCGITEDQIKTSMQIKYDKKGGFAAGNFVETLELVDNDEWVSYYRKRPDIYPEI